MHKKKNHYWSTVRFLFFWLWPIFAIAISSAQDVGSPQTVQEVPERIMAARLVNVVAPNLPEHALMKCSNAMVIVRVIIGQDGKVSSAEFKSGFSELHDSALAAIKQWTYKPYGKHRHFIPVQTDVSIFYLGDGETFPMYSPNGKGGVKGGNVIPLPPGCGSGPVITRPPPQ